MSHHLLGRQSPSNGYTCIILCCLMLAVSPLTNRAGTSASSAAQNAEERSNHHQRYDCGFDPRGANDESLNHAFYQFRRSRLGPSIASIATLPPSEDVGDLAVIVDNGTLVIPPGDFDLKNESVLFTPEDAGFRISRSELVIEDDFGTRLRDFVGIDGRGDSDNGYKEVQLEEAPFGFYGTEYDSIFVGTNGYITFGGGDTNARISPAALAEDLPRIAALWADLDASHKGGIYYRRAPGRHLVTWKKLPQTTYSGKSTFQVSLYDDGRIGFAYRGVKVHAALIGLSPGGREDAEPLDLSRPPSQVLTQPFFESFSSQKRLDLAGLSRAFYRTHPDEFDTIYIWTDFTYDNGLGIAHEFNVRNDIRGIGLRLYDRGALYGSPSRLGSVITMGNAADWPADPHVRMAGLNSAVAIVCHEQGHRWLSYVQWNGARTNKDSLLGRDQSHWSFFLDTRSRPSGSFSSLMEGNSWDGGSTTGVFATIETDVNYFSPLDQYLMGLRRPDEVGDLSYLVTDDDLTFILQEKSPVSGFSLSATRKKISVQDIIDEEGTRVPDSFDAPKQIRVAFVLLVEAGTSPSHATISKVASYREALTEYFSLATSRRASMDASLGSPSSTRP